MASTIKDYTKLCIHTYTTRPWGLEECIKNYTSAGIPAVSIWRNALENKNLKEIRKYIDGNDITVVSLVRGGFFPSVNPGKRQSALDDNLIAIEQAVLIGAPLIVVVCGADQQQSLEKSREQIMKGIIKILPVAEKAGIKLAIEPLHPVYAGDRSAINTLKQANDMASEINSKWLGVAVDVFHLWWDPDLKSEIKRCAINSHLFAFHICDWKVPVVDILNDRGLMGEGCINVTEIRSWMEEAGFDGYNEVEIFSEKYWAMDQKLYLEKIKAAYLNSS